MHGLTEEIKIDKCSHGLLPGDGLNRKQKHSDWKQFKQEGGQTLVCYFVSLYPNGFRK